MPNKNKIEDDVLIRYWNVELCRGENSILEDVTFELRKGDFLYILGIVGSGKSSLLQTLYCEMPIESGEAHIFEYNLRKMKRKKIPLLRRKLGIVFQDFQLLTDRSVQANLEFVLKATGWKNKKAIAERIQTVLDQVGMGTKGYKMPYTLSGGEQQRIVIARALLNSPAIILADEPTGNLDVESGAHIVQLLHKICEQGTAVIMTTHNQQWAKRFPGKIMQCTGGKLVDYDITQQKIDENTVPNREIKKFTDSLLFLRYPAAEQNAANSCNRSE
ncbi:phosphonate ABC transporter ATP-binding protein [Bacteroidia bacterium]|nr:phosphonate ABC transporter ATP-binding protein [Bacteroidia bacterium]